MRGSPSESTIACSSRRPARILNDRIVRRWQRDGVTVKDPATTWIDDTVTLAPDVTILPNTHILGATTVD